VQAIRAVSQCRSFLTRKVTRILPDDYVSPSQRRGLEDRYDLLSDRECEVLQMIAEGRSNKEVANLLNISPTSRRNPSRPHPPKARHPQRPGTSSSTPCARA
jgi:DNA-binding NarL/FixJ family response regulator